jgi:hypothetical protein
MSVIMEERNFHLRVWSFAASQTAFRLPHGSGLCWSALYILCPRVRGSGIGANLRPSRAEARSARRSRGPGSMARTGSAWNYFVAGLNLRVLEQFSVNRW